MGITMMALAVFPAMAANNVTIGTTGPSSLNYVWLNNARKVKVNNFNIALVVNNQTSNTTTGGNTVDHNTNVTGGVGSGSATSNTTVDNQINGSQTVINECNACSSGDTNVTINTTGPDSTNNVTVDNSSKIKVNNVQIGVVFNRINTTTSTGGNTVTNNTISGGAGSSGNASSNTGVTNWLNTSSTFINATPPSTP
jgi:hypothetical protein